MASTGVWMQILWSLKAARFGLKLFQSPWNLKGTLAAVLPRWLPNFRAIGSLKHAISWFWGFTTFSEYKPWSFNSQQTLHIDTHIDGLVQERHNSSALLMGLRLSCTNPSIYNSERWNVYCEYFEEKMNIASWVRRHWPQYGGSWSTALN